MAEEKSQYEDTIGYTLHGSRYLNVTEPLRYFALCILPEIQWYMVCQRIRDVVHHNPSVEELVKRR